MVSPQFYESGFNGAAESLRGSTMFAQMSRHEIWASMGPRSHSADLQGQGSQSPKKVYELQWGRGVTPRIYAQRKSGWTRRRFLLQWGRGVTPRIYPIPEVFVQVLGASMGPRSHSADLRWRGGVNAPGIDRFNGAAESLRGSTPHAVSRRSRL
ncbi:protein of unknown function [Kyrpidia spormannii]|uniref:Uncharacterized protein n=1 Tax=Kyrpidia spormannii TaxID=2055160 RepID=A0A6F9EH87_9BACL|nr:protein of unknown function [Kyrpidia spormannii]